MTALHAKNCTARLQGWPVRCELNSNAFELFMLACIVGLNAVLVVYDTQTPLLRTAAVVVAGLAVVAAIAALVFNGVHRHT